MNNTQYVWDTFLSNRNQSQSHSNSHMQKNRMYLGINTYLLKQDVVYVDVFIDTSRKGKPIVRWGRKATGLNEIAGLPKEYSFAFLYLFMPKEYP